jgi:hypothetical protein
MISERDTEKIFHELSQLKDSDLEREVRARLLRRRSTLLFGWGRDEDPCDVFVDAFEGRNGDWPLLLRVCASLALEWGKSVESVAFPEGVGELHYLCARIGALDARPGIADTIVRVDFRGVLLPSGEGVQLRALRSLAGLLAISRAEEFARYIGLYEEALTTPQHLPISLVTLLAFRPRRRDMYVERAQKYWPAHVEALLPTLDRDVEFLKSLMRPTELETSSS